MSDEVAEALEYLEELSQEDDSSKRTKEQLTRIMDLLKKNEQLAIEKALMLIEEMSSENLPPHQRTQLMYISSLLEAALTNNI